MRVREHKLEVESKDGVALIYKEARHYTDREIQQKYIVLHFTAGVNFDRSVRTLTHQKVSSHFVISRSERKIAQLVPLNKKAWHAGDSKWEGISGLNSHSIGIEIDNAGKLDYISKGVHKGAWSTWFNQIIRDEAEVYTHTDGTHWHTYPKLQLEVLVDLLVCLCAEYKIPVERIITHEMISPGRKVDTGPAFPLEDIRNLVASRLSSTE